MNELMIFNNPEFGTVRTLEENGVVLFSATDVARALGYSNPYDAIARHCKGVVKREGVSRTTNQHGKTTEQSAEMSFIHESDLYRLVFSSKLPTAEKFTDWVTEEVIPSIRKHGAYMTPATIEKILDDPDTIIRLATSLKEEREKRRTLEVQAEADRPKVLFADSVAASKNSILVGEMAKLLKQNGVETGQNRFFEYLRQNGYLIRRQGTDYNMPTQKSMELGLFEIKETTINHADGHTSVNKTPKITGKGQQYFVNMFLGGEA